MKNPRTKNTLLQFAQGNRTKQKLQESIFSPTQIKLKNKKFPPLQKNKTSFQRTMQTLNCIASNVNRFGQGVCGLQTVVLRTDSRAAHNIRLKEILKRRALFGNQTVVLLIGSCGNTNSGASLPTCRALRQAGNPFFLKLL